MHRFFVEADRELWPWRVAVFLDVAHWPAVLAVLIFGWAWLPGIVWMGCTGLTVAFQTRYCACPLIVWTNALRRRSAPDYERHGRSLVALAYRHGRLLGAAISFTILMASSMLTQHWFS